MEQEIKDAIGELRQRGYAVVVFTPEEVRGMSPSEFQDRLIEYGNAMSESLKTRGRLTPEE